jgi:type VI secretion system secreted protein Hcp
MAQADFYLKIDGIEGESMQKGFEKAIEIESWSFGATNAGSAGQGSGLGAGKATVQDFHFVVKNGAASPQLFRELCRGTHIKNAVLNCRKTGGDANPFTYLKVTFKECVISSFQTGASSGGNILPTEQISFNFSDITIEYFQQKKDGSVSLKNTTTFNVKTGSAA